MRGVRRRRVLKVALLRASRIVRRHHLSLLSGVVLSIALVFALTDGQFDSPGSRPVEAIAPATPRSTAAAPLNSGGDRGSVIYYLVSSREQIRLLSTTLRGDSRYVQEQGLPPMPPVAVYFLLFETPEQEAEGARFLNQLADMAPHQGLSLRVVDLTR